MDAFITSLVTVTLAEIGDKTQLLSIFLAARFSNKPSIIAGILVATLLNHAVSAWLGSSLGSWLGDFLTNDMGKWVIGGSFVLIGLWLLIPDKESDNIHYREKYGAFLVTTALFFLAEIGDKTQVVTIALGAQFQSIIIITLGTTLGMLIANIPVIYMGEALMRRVSLTHTRAFAAVIYAIIGLFMIFL